jgi:SAM-dependent methyltransferase
MADERTRTEQQRRYFFEPLLRLAGGDLEGRRVLDLGCGDGFWSLQAIEAGAEFVLGVDPDAGAVEQARRRLHEAGVAPERARVEQAAVPAAPIADSYDVVLCIALMERTGKPVELFELLAAVGAELAVIDTELSAAPSSFFELSLEPPAASGVADAGAGIVLLPSREAVVELAAQFGYDSVALAHEMGDYEGLGDYRDQRRVAFICASQISLDELPWEEPPPVTPWWRALLDPSLRGWQLPA